MRVNLTLTLEVGADPAADAITYMIYQYGNAEPNVSTLDSVEAVILDILDSEMPESGTLPGWEIVASFIEPESPA